jgi:hypothetical protein
MTLHVRLGHWNSLGVFFSVFFFFFFKRWARKNIYFSLTLIDYK